MMTTLAAARKKPRSLSHPTTQHLSRTHPARPLHRQTQGVPHEAQGCTHACGEAGALGCDSNATARVGSEKGPGRPRQAGEPSPVPLSLCSGRGFRNSMPPVVLCAAPLSSCSPHIIYPLLPPRPQEPWPLFGLGHLLSSSSSRAAAAAAAASAAAACHRLIKEHLLPATTQQLVLASRTPALVCLSRPSSSFSRVILLSPRKRLPTTVADSTGQDGDHQLPQRQQRPQP